MANRELVQLSQTYDGKKCIAGWFESSKLDGFRMWWDGGVSRGLPKDVVPWANTDKDERYKDKQFATGLWTRYGNVVHAPRWFLDALPKGELLDGEGWSPVLSRQVVRSFCSKLVPLDHEWAQIQFWVVNRLSPNVLFAIGKINNPNYSKMITKASFDFFVEQGGSTFGVYSNAAVYNHLVKKADSWKPEVLQLVRQNQIPYVGWQEYVANRLIEEMGKPHGEGLILSDPNAATEMVRSHNSLKVKPRDDAEATVVGYISARDGKLRGLLGALIVNWDGVVFELSGFTDEERRLSETSWAYNHLEEELPPDIHCVRFPRGTQVTFSYRGLTDDGKPNEAVYFRGRD